MAMTSNVSFKRDARKGQWVEKVNGKKPVGNLAKLRVPPAWTRVSVDPDPKAYCLAMGYDEAGRLQRLYSPEHIAASKSNKFERVRSLLAEWDDIGTQIEADLNLAVKEKDKQLDSILVAYLIYETAMRPGSTAEVALTTGIQAYGATTLQLRHVKPCARGVRLQFVGKKGVKQNVLVTNPYLVKTFIKRKNATTAWSADLFPDTSAGLLRQYFATLGSGDYTPKDFRTARGTKLALELLGNRKRLPASHSGRRKLVNNALDKVAKLLGNTRSVARSAYVDPDIIENLLEI